MPSHADRELEDSSDKHPDSLDHNDEEKAISSDAEKNPGEAPAEPEAKPPAGPPGGPVPNGGLQAWLQVLGSWMLFFNTWGLLNTFGTIFMMDDSKIATLTAPQVSTKHTTNLAPSSLLPRQTSPGSVPSKP